MPEIDHLYLDINGIIHNVSHNNDLLTACNVKSSEQVYSDVCAIIDSILKLIRPKRLLMISADGVAPRAKMNQQRSRRFRKEELSPEERISEIIELTIDTSTSLKILTRFKKLDLKGISPLIVASVKSLISFSFPII